VPKWLAYWRFTFLVRINNSRKTKNRRYFNLLSQILNTLNPETFASNSKSNAPIPVKDRKPLRSSALRSASKVGPHVCSKQGFYQNDFC
jgi:hypothetical protein